jgi:gliding motility-associated-like protein
LNNLPATIYVFDRMGKLLKQLTPDGDGWDGNYHGAPMPASDYWFLVEYEENGMMKKFKSHFSLKR